MVNLLYIKIKLKMNKYKNIIFKFLFYKIFKNIKKLFFFKEKVLNNTNNSLIINERLIK